MANPRVYADFNGLQHSVRTSGHVALYLHYFGTLQDLSRLQVQLHEGMQLSVYSDSDDNEDLEAAGVVHFDDTAQQWFAEFEQKEMRYVASVPAVDGPKFPCWNCRAELDTQIKTSGLKHGDACGQCGVAIHEPLKPPARKG